MHRLKRASPLAHSNRRASRVFPFRTCARKRRMWVSRDLSVSARWPIFSIPQITARESPPSLDNICIPRALSIGQLITEIHNCLRVYQIADLYRFRDTRKVPLKKAAFWRDENLRNLIRIFSEEITRKKERYKYFNTRYISGKYF